MQSLLVSGATLPSETIIPQEAGLSLQRLHLKNNLITSLL